MKNLRDALLSGLTLCLIFLLPACARQHYVEMDADSLSFYFADSDAERILFVSSIDRFQPLPARKVNKDVWKVTVPLSQEFEYFYLVDGTPTLPDCRYTVYDDFGGKNCLYVHGL
jgi:hypothetical protein